MNKKERLKCINQYCESKTINEKVSILFSNKVNNWICDFDDLLDLNVVEAINHFSNTLFMKAADLGIPVVPADNKTVLHQAGKFSTTLLSLPLKYNNDKCASLILDPTDNSLGVAFIDLMRMKVHGDTFSDLAEDYEPMLNYQKNCVKLISILKENNTKALFSLNDMGSSLNKIIKETKESNLFSIFKRIKNKDEAISSILKLYEEVSVMIDTKIEKDILTLKELDFKLIEDIQSKKCSLERVLNESYKIYNLPEVSVNVLFINELDSSIWFKDEIEDKRKNIQEELDRLVNPQYSAV